VRGAGNIPGVYGKLLHQCLPAPAGDGVYGKPIRTFPFPSFLEGPYGIVCERGGVGAVVGEVEDKGVDILKPDGLQELERAVWIYPRGKGDEVYV
jgi:hypothetical protein